MEHKVRNACKNELPKNQSAVGTTEMGFCRAYSTFYIIMVINAGVPCYALHRLPIVCRHYVTPFFELKIENIECRKFVETRQCILQKIKTH